MCCTGTVHIFRQPQYIFIFLINIGESSQVYIHNQYVCIQKRYLAWAEVCPYTVKWLHCFIMTAALAQSPSLPRRQRWRRQRRRRALCVCVEHNGPIYAWNYSLSVEKCYRWVGLRPIQSPLLKTFIYECCVYVYGFKWKLCTIVADFRFKIDVGIIKIGDTKCAP